MKIKHGFEGERFIIIPYRHIVSMSRNPLCSDLFIQSIGYFPMLVTISYPDRKAVENVF